MSEGNIAYRNKPPEEWEQGKHVISTKKAMRQELAKGMIQFCSLCGVDVPEKAIPDLIGILEKHGD
jgi:hypothetical protein